MSWLWCWWKITPPPSRELRLWAHRSCCLYLFRSKKLVLATRFRRARLLRTCMLSVRPAPTIDRMMNGLRRCLCYCLLSQRSKVTPTNALWRFAKCSVTVQLSVWPRWLQWSMQPRRYRARFHVCRRHNEALTTYKNRHSAVLLVNNTNAIMTRIDLTSLSLSIPTATSTALLNLLRINHRQIDAC